MSSPSPTLSVGTVQSLAGKLQLRSKIQSVIGLAIVLVIALIFSPRNSEGLVFLDAGNITDILRQASEIGILSLAMTFVILTGGIDLSVGSTLALSSSIVALLVTRPLLAGSEFGSIAVAILAATAATTLVGLANGVVIARWRIQPFIVTLAAMIGIRGLARWLTNNSNIDIGFGTDLASTFARTLSTKTVVIGSYVILAVLFGILLSRTVFGRRVRAIGDNEKAAQYAGLPIRKLKVLVYVISGLLAGYAGVLHAAQNHQGSPNAGVTYELEAIAAVVIGGTSLLGGRGSIAGTIIGTMIVGVLTNILRLNNVDSNLEMMLKAVIIVTAVWLQQRGKE
ncbi:MAG TPA: ABC transporter permease [Clostridia bacterium]|nr:ABC transporter permease [Clostridia bacterium]